MVNRKSGVKVNIKRTVVLFTFMLLMSCTFVYADRRDDAEQSIGGWVSDIYNLLFPVAIVYGVVEIILAGYQIMRSEGEPNALKEGKEHLTETLIGIIFLILAMVILKVIIKSFLGQ